MSEVEGTSDQRWNGRDFGRLEGRVEAMQRDIGSLVANDAVTQSKLADINERLASTRGALKALVTVGAVGGAVGAGVHQIFGAINALLGP